MRYTLFTVICLFFLSAGAQDHTQVDYNGFIKECQISQGEGGNMELVWWIPFEFWEITFKRNNMLSEEQIESFNDLMKSYVLFAVVEGEVGSMGKISFNSKEDIFGRLKLTGNDAKEYAPLTESEINPEVVSILAGMRPILTNAMGDMGKNMHFFVFTDESKKEVPAPEGSSVETTTEIGRVSDPYKSGIIKINTGKKDYQWRTPLGTLIPPKVCPVDQAEMNGAWEFCPWHGEKLAASDKE